MQLFIGKCQLILYLIKNEWLQFDLLRFGNFFDGTLGHFIKFFFIEKTECSGERMIAIAQVCCSSYKSMHCKAIKHDTHKLWLSIKKEEEEEKYKSKDNKLT